MLDYEVGVYKLEYLCSGYWHCTTFDTEENVVKFIKEHSANWKNYRLLKIMIMVGEVE